jgi:glutaredoxin
MRCGVHGLEGGADGCVLCRRKSSAKRSSGRLSPLAAALVAIAVCCVAAIGYTVFRRATDSAVSSLQAEPSASVDSALSAGEPHTEETGEVPAPAPEPVAETPELDAGPPSFETPPLRPPPSATAAAAAAAPAEAPASPPAPSPNQAPPPDRLRAAMQRVPITMYTTTWCGHCERARHWMRNNAFRFTEHDVEASEAAGRAHKALNPRGGVPVIDIDGEVLVGFSEAHVARALARAAERRMQ